MVIFIIVDEDRTRAGLGYGFGGGNKGVGGGDDFVSGANAGGFKADVDSIGAVGAGNAVLDPVSGGKVLFKGFNVFSTDKSRVIED